MMFEKNDFEVQVKVGIAHSLCHLMKLDKLANSSEGD
jgi:hypothetical protein